MAWPAFFRVGYNSETHELFIAYDIGLAPEKPEAHLRFCRFDFDPKWQFRAALARYYDIFPEYFRRRTPKPGLWMPFAKISTVKDWQDFGFKFKEGTDETPWDDEHGIITFRYTEPMTWWMRMPKETPRTLSAALAEAQHLAREKGDPHAQSLLTSGFHSETGQFPVQLLSTPWCDGAVWSINSMPNVQGEITDFKNKWSPTLREKLYGPHSNGDLDGEYIDSSEGYVTDELDFRRDHFSAAGTPLTFSCDDHKVGIFRGLIAFEYVRAIAQDIRAMGKPYCFLMNTRFEEFPHELVEKYMKRCLAYGMFPGFFSHNASQGHYFTRPELYDRDRDLFKKYVPLCKLVAEAGWEPMTHAHSSDSRVYVERFGNRFFTIFNDSTERRAVTITLDQKTTSDVRELVNGHTTKSQGGQINLTIEGEDVAVIQTN
jgi:hypothetical protein